MNEEKNKQWEEKFDEMFIPLNKEDLEKNNIIKDFIRSVISFERQKLREEILEFKELLKTKSKK